MNDAQRPDPSRGADRIAAVARSGDLDRAIHEPARLGIVALLLLDGPLTFAQLKRRLDLTDGNLGLHARRLEEAGYISARRLPGPRGSLSEFTLTNAGRRALEAYTARMSALIQAVSSR